MRLFCFTYAGGSGALFDGLRAYLGPEIELVELEYAGHIGRHHEPFYGSFDELTADMYGLVREKAGEQDYALFGYSMGAIAAAEVTKMLLAKGEMPLPAHVFLASHGLRPMGEHVRTDGEDTDEAVMRWTERFGGIPEKLTGSRTFWRVYLPIYRADHRLITEYEFSRLDYATDIPATVLFSPEDISRGEMEKWRGVFTGECDFQEYDGGHFFLRQHEREVADVIKGRLGRYGV